MVRPTCTHSELSHIYAQTMQSKVSHINKHTHTFHHTNTHTHTGTKKNDTSHQSCMERSTMACSLPHGHTHTHTHTHTRTHIHTHTHTHTHTHITATVEPFFLTTQQIFISKVINNLPDTLLVLCSSPRHRGTEPE